MAWHVDMPMSARYWWWVISTPSCPAWPPTSTRRVSARGVPLDGADEESVASTVELAVDAFGRLDGVHLNFTNASDAYLPGGVVDLPLEAFDEVMRVNTRGFVICAKHMIPLMIDSGGGSIVFTASIDAYNGASTRVSYQMSKAPSWR